MLPKAPQTAQGDLFKSELIAIIDSNHPLVRLADKIDWQQFEKSLHPTYVPGKGAPAINTRLMVALHILKFQHNLSDQAVVDRWVENPYWQFFSGMRFFSHQPPVDPSSMTRWRTRLGESGSEEILKASLQTALKVGAARVSDFKDVNVDTTVQTKDIRYPTDSRLYHRVLERLVKTARKEGFVIKQSYARVSKRLLMMQARYAHARQMNRAKGVQRKLRTKLGRVIREVERQAPGANTSTAEVLILAQRIHQQERSDRGKIYSVHEPLVECIAKGKVSKKYEFGSKVSVAVSSKRNWVMGAQSLSGNPYDGHTLSGQLEQVRNMVGLGVVERVFVDQGYRGHGSDGPEQVHVDRRRRGNIQRRLWRLMKRRAAIEPIIGHMKSEHRLERNRLKGTIGDKVNAILSAAAMNFTKLIAWLKFFLSFLRALFSFVIPNHSLIQTAKA